MKLRGSAVKKLKPSQRKKMEKTLKVMQGTREEDSRFLRTIAKEKLETLIKARQITLQQIESKKAELQDLKIKVLRFNGGIETLDSLLNTKKEKNDNGKN